MGLATSETLILEMGVGILGLGLALITGGLVGVLLARHQYKVVFPLGLILVAVALLLWWEPLVRVVVSFPLLLVGYSWLLAWCRASQQRSDWVFSHHARLARGGRRAARHLGSGLRSAHLASSTRKGLETRPTDENVHLARSTSWDEGDGRGARM